MDEFVTVNESRIVTAHGVFNNNVLEIGNKIIITGTGGIGKSVMMKHFFLNVLQNTQYVPVLIELR